MTKTIRAFFVTAAVAFAIGAGVLFAASAAFAQVCQPAELVIMQIAAMPNVAAPRVLTGKPLEKAVEIFHAVPPESNEPLTVVLLVDLPDGGGVMLVGQDDMVCGGLRLNEHQWRALINTIDGRPA